MTHFLPPHVPSLHPSLPIIPSLLLGTTGYFMAKINLFLLLVLIVHVCYNVSVDKWYSYVKLYTIEKLIGNLLLNHHMKFNAWHLTLGRFWSNGPGILWANKPCNESPSRWWNTAMKYELYHTTISMIQAALLAMMTVATWITWKVSCQTGKLMSFKSGTSKPNDTQHDYRPAMYLVVSSVAEHWSH